MKLVLAQHTGANQLVGRLTLVVLRVGFHSEFGGQPEHSFVRVADPLGAEFDWNSRYHVLREDSSADALVGFQDQRLSPASSTFRAAIIPESPAPTMMTSASKLFGCAMGNTLSPTPRVLGYVTQIRDTRASTRHSTR